MDIILNWLKPILYFTIFMTFLMQLIPKEKYKKYIQFFAGLLLIILVLHPVLNLFGKEEISGQIFNELFYEQQSESVEFDLEEMWETQKKSYQIIYEEILDEEYTKENNE